MQTEIQHQIDIDAPPAAVWAHLADTAAYEQWNPFVRELDGTLEKGERLTVRIAPPGGRAMTFRPTVLAARPGEELRWRGPLLVPGLFDGEHRFTLEALPGGRTRLTQSERFAGLLVRVSRRALARTRDGFEEMNAALRDRVEAA